MQVETVMIPRAPQRSLAIMDAEEREVVAAVEMLSPSNKRVGEGAMSTWNGGTTS